jgi:hypothetical protein
MIKNHLIREKPLQRYLNIFLLSAIILRYE